jgi:hypothetical protein
MQTSPRVTALCRMLESGISPQLRSARVESSKPQEKLLHFEISAELSPLSFAEIAPCRLNFPVESCNGSRKEHTFALRAAVTNSQPLRKLRTVFLRPHVCFPSLSRPPLQQPRHPHGLTQATSASRICSHITHTPLLPLRPAVNLLLLFPHQYFPGAGARVQTR